MTDPVQSGGNAPAADSNAAVPAGGTTQAFGTFTSTRGSGLARGKAKRSPNPTADSAAPAPGGDYKPTALEVITPEREYKNPFGDPAEPAPAPLPAAPQPVAAEKPTKAPAPAVVEAPRAPVADLFPLETEANEDGAKVPAKAELNILPQAETKRPALNWENAPPPAPSGRSDAPVYAPRPAREERPTFRPEPRRDQRSQEVREPRPEDREPRTEPRDSRPEGREPRPEFRDSRRDREPARSAPAPAARPKPRGFIAWLKDLFGVFGDKPAAQPSPETHREERGLDRDGQPRRRRRGGRGRHSDGRSGGQPGHPQGEHGGEARFQGGERRGDERRGEHQGGEHGGNRPRRHRGGRGRSRGDHGGGPRPEGHQGGGAI